MASSSTTPHTRCRMAMLSARDEHSDRRLTRLREAVGVVDEMAQLLEVAFGPDGRAVLFQCQTGPVALSRSGLEILNNTYETCSNPIRHVVIDNARIVSNTVGDGIKTFVFLINAMLERLNDLNRFETYRLLKEFQTKLDTILSSGSKSELKGNIAISHGFIEAFFSVRFTKPVSKALIKCVKELVETNPADVLMFDYMCRNFSVFCSNCPVSNSVSESIVSEGIRFIGKVSGLLSGVILKCLVRIYHTDEKNQMESEEIDSDLMRLLCEPESQCAMRVVLISNVVLPDLALYYVRKHKIGLVEGASDEVTKVLFDRQLCLTASNKDFIAELKLEYTGIIWLSMPNIYHIYISSPTPEIGKQLVDAIRDCFRLVNYTLKRSSWPHCTSGSFEREFAFLLMAGIKNTHEHISIPVINRKELLEWRKKSNSLKMKNEDNVNIFDTVAASELFDVSLLQSTSEVNRGRSNHYLAQLVEKLTVGQGGNTAALDLLSTCYMTVARKLPECDILTNAADAISVKLFVLNAALSTVLTLCNLGGIINIKRQPK